MKFSNFTAVYEDDPLPPPEPFTALPLAELQEEYRRLLGERNSLWRAVKPLYDGLHEQAYGSALPGEKVRSARQRIEIFRRDAPELARDLGDG